MRACGEIFRRAADLRLRSGPASAPAPAHQPSRKPRPDRRRNPYSAFLDAEREAPPKPSSAVKLHQGDCFEGATIDLAGQSLWRSMVSGIVNFVISEPTDLDIELSDKVRKRYGLKSALVLKGPDQLTSALTEALGSLAAQLLEEMLEDGQLLGVAWGRTLAAAARALTRLPRVDVVQVGGNPTGLDFALNPVEIVHRIAHAGGGKPY